MWIFKQEKQKFVIYQAVVYICRCVEWYTFARAFNVPEILRYSCNFVIFSIEGWKWQRNTCETERNKRTPNCCGNIFARQWIR